MNSYPMTRYLVKSVLLIVVGVVFCTVSRVTEIVLLAAFGFPFFAWGCVRFLPLLIGFFDFGPEIFVDLWKEVKNEQQGRPADGLPILIWSGRMPSVQFPDEEEQGGE